MALVRSPWVLVGGTTAWWDLSGSTYGRSLQGGLYIEVYVCLPFGIASPLKLTLGSEARITFEVRRWLSILHNLGGDLSGEIRPPHPRCLSAPPSDGTNE